ncbi:hypothetical protein [Streptomyces sp. NPDC049881]|uniref:hypothetical protein n=1 Tax=unclassified Streptomyces TaxID=2593676 RepID=UPI00341655D1
MTCFTAILPPMYEILAAEATTPQWIAAIASVISALGGAAGFAALVITLRRRRTATRLPPFELRRLLHELEEMLGELISNGGMPTDWFLAPEQRRTSQLLASYSGLLADDELNALVSQARVAADDCWAAAPPVLPGAAAAGLPPTELAEIDQRLERQLEQARTGRDVLLRAISRLDELMRESTRTRTPV